MHNASNHLIPIFDAIPLPCIIIQQDGLNYTIKDANNAFQTASDNCKTQLIGNNLSSILADENEEQIAALNLIINSATRVFTTKQAVAINDVQLNINKKNQQLEYWSITHSPILDGNGNVEFILQSFTNTTATTIAKNKVEAPVNEESILLENTAIDRIKNNQAAIINSTDDIIFSIDKNFRLVTINASYQQLLFAVTGRLEKEGDQVLTGRLGKELTEKWKGYFERAFKGEKFSIQEAMYNPFKGYKQYGLINFNPVFNANGEIDSVACFAKDITASTVSYLELEKSKIELDKIFSASLDVICAVDENNVFVKVSPASKKVWGYEPEEMIGHSIFEFIHPDYAHTTEIAIEQVKQSVTTTNFENKYIKKDGTVATIEWSSSWDANEQIRYGTARDITEKKKNELALVESEKQYKTLFEDSPLPMFIWEFDTKKILNCNYEALELYGYTRDEFLGLTLLDIRPAEDIPILMEAAKNEETYGKVHKQLWRHKKKNGDIIHVNLHAHILDYQGRRASLVLVNDITEKLKTEEKIKQTNERYEYVLKATSDAVWDCDIKNDLIYWGEGLKTLFGYDPVEYSGKPTTLFFNLVHPEDRDNVQKDLGEALLGNTSTWSGEFRFLKSNGDYAYVVEKGYILRDENGNAIRVVGSKRDVTNYRYLSELEKLERNILAAGQIGDKNVNETLRTYLLGLEALHPNMICSINEKKCNQLFHVAAPSLPQGFIDIANGISIGNNVGSCGTASYLKEKVIVSDIANDPHWADIKDIAAQYQLAACWSYPIISQKNEVIGTFAAYHHSTKTPNEQEENTINRAVNIIQIILENATRTNALEESNLRYAYVTKATSDAIYDWNLENDSVFVGDVFSKIFGWSLDDLQEKRKVWATLVHPEDRESVVKSLYDALYSDVINWRSEYRFFKANGDYAYVIDRAYIIRNSSGKAIRIVGSKRDVTERNKELLRLKLLESAITNTNDVVVISEAESYDASGPRIIYVNEAFTTLTGYLPSEVIGKTPRIVQGPKTDAKELERLKYHMNNFEACEVTLINYKKTGEEYWVNLSVNPVADETGKVTHWVSLQRDVTDKKQQEINMMKAIIKTQEDERYEVGGELHDNVCQILTSSQISLKMLKKYLPENDQHRLNEGLEYIALATHEIRNLSHRLAPAFFADTTIEEAFTNLVRTFNIENDFHVTIHFDEAFKQQPARREFQLNMYRILQEQLKNILKHAQATIINVIGKVQNETLKIEVIDNGIGFDINNVKSGIGIANMRRRTELFSGKFNIQSTIGSGCTLTVEVPIKEIV